MLPLPLLWEIVTADASLSGNGGAKWSVRGGRWEIKNARCREIRTRAVESMVISWDEEFGGDICIRGHRPGFHEL